MKPHALIVSADNADDLALLTQIIKRMELSSAPLTQEELEDLGLLALMLEEPQVEYVSEKAVKRELEKE